MPTAASSLGRPAAMAAQNRRRASRPAAEGRPGERNGARPDRSERRFCLLIATPSSGCCDDHLSPGSIRNWFDCSFEVTNEVGQVVLTMPFSETIDEN